MAIFLITLRNIDDSTTEGQTIMNFINSNLSKILADNPQTQVTVQRLS